MASKLGRKYRIPHISIEMLLWATRTRKDISFREYTGSQIEDFLKTDGLDDEARDIADRFFSNSE